MLHVFVCVCFLGCSQHSQYVFSGTVPALPVSTGNTLTPTGHTVKLHKNESDIQVGSGMF